MGPASNSRVQTRSNLQGDFQRENSVGASDQGKVCPMTHHVLCLRFFTPGCCRQACETSVIMIGVLQFSTASSPHTSTKSLSLFLATHVPTCLPGQVTPSCTDVRQEYHAFLYAENPTDCVDVQCSKSGMLSWRCQLGCRQLSQSQQTCRECLTITSKLF